MAKRKNTGSEIVETVVDTVVDAAEEIVEDIAEDIGDAIYQLGVRVRVGRKSSVSIKEAASAAFFRLCQGGDAEARYELLAWIEELAGPHDEDGVWSFSGDAKTYRQIVSALKDAGAKVDAGRFGKKRLLAIRGW